MLTPRNVLVVGGGIAGLTVAGALAGRGHAVRVVEVEPTWPTVGWGLSLTGPALRALETLGLAERCTAEGFGINEVHNRGRDFELLAVQTMPKLLGPDRVAQVGIRRPVLREILRQHAASHGAVLDSGITITALREDPPHASTAAHAGQESAPAADPPPGRAPSPPPGHTADPSPGRTADLPPGPAADPSPGPAADPTAGPQPSPRGPERSGVRVEFTDGTAAHYDLVIGADGIRSATRSMLGINIKPRYTGQMVWRARVPRPAWADVLTTVGDGRTTAGLIPIAADEAYIFHTENTPHPTPLPPDQLADVMRERLKNFKGPFADAVAAIVDPAQVVRRPVHVLLADAPWRRGRTVLIGDAVHAPSPQLISGAAIAIEDAVVLAEMLSHEAKSENNQEDEFTTRRYNRCAAVVDASIRMSELERTGNQLEAHDVQNQAFRALAAPL